LGNSTNIKSRFAKYPGTVPPAPEMTPEEIAGKPSGAALRLLQIVRKDPEALHAG